ncbi:MAG: nuclear transport factor 2 family protein [Gemmatimonadaceae bacterium]
MFLFLVSFVPPIHAQQDRAVEKALFKLEDDFTAAVVKRDAKALGKIVAPKWVYSDESGVMQRDEGIKAFTSGSDTVTSASNADMRALVYPGTAVVIGILQLKGRGPSGPFTRRYRYTDTWVLLDGRWQCVASQDYLMPEKKR